MLWLQASCEIDGQINLTTDEMAFRFRMSHNEFLDALNPLIKAGLFVDASGMLAECLQSARPETERETKTEEKKRRMSRQEKINSLDGYSPAALEVVRTLLHAWPAERPKGGKIDLDPDTACSRVMSILDRHPSLTPEMLIGAGTNYLAKMEGKGDYISALHFFFGPGKGSDMPKWETEIRAINHQRSLS